MTEEELVLLERTYDSIYFNKLSYASALLSAGGAIDTCRAVVSRQTKNGIAVIRPPGHHAESSRPMGFCLFDNVSISAKVCQLDYPETCRKILIVDWYAFFRQTCPLLLMNDLQGCSSWFEPFFMTDLTLINIS